MVTDSGAPAKDERIVAAASELVYRQGLARTTLADVAQAADVVVGNLYYYFKTKDDLVAAIVHAHARQLGAALDELESRHRSPRARLKALVGVLAGRRDRLAQYGCRYGTLGAELAKRAGGSDPLAARLMRVPLDWTERQFRAMGQRHAPDLAVQLFATFQGSALLSNALGQPELMARQARRLERWIDLLASAPDRHAAGTTGKG